MCFVTPGVLCPDERGVGVELSCCVLTPWLAGVAFFWLGVVYVRRSGFALCRGKANAAARVDVPQTLVLDPETELVSPLTDLEHVESKHTLVETFPECLDGVKVDLAVLSRMLGVPQGFLYDFVFEHGLCGLVDTVLATARVWAAAHDLETPRSFRKRQPHQTS